MNSGIQRPTDVMDLLLRIFPPAVEGSRECRPFLTSVFALGEDNSPSGEAVAATMHSVTSLDAYLSHAQPLAGKRLAICVMADGGEVLRMVMEIVSTGAADTLWETNVRFLR